MERCNLYFGRSGFLIATTLLQGSNGALGSSRLPVGIPETMHPIVLHHHNALQTKAGKVNFSA